MKTRRITALAALLCAALASAHAIASPVSFELSGGGVSWATDLTANIHYTPTQGGGFSEDVWVGPLSLNVTNLSTHATSLQSVYCTDIFDDYVSGGIYRLGPLTQTLSLTEADRIDALLSHVTPSNAIQGAAVQAAVWKIENDPGNNSITSGTFSLSQDGYTGASDFNAMVALTDTYLTNVDNGTWKDPPGTSVEQYTVAPGGGRNQTFAFLDPVHAPEPASLALLGSALIGTLVLRRRQVPRRIT